MLTAPESNKRNFSLTGIVCSLTPGGFIRLWRYHWPSLKGVAMQPVHTRHGSHDIHRHVMDRVAPPRYRLELPTHGLGQ
jgi:hypothetical protein